MTNTPTPNEAFVTLPSHDADDPAFYGVVKKTGADLDHFDPKYMGVHVVLPGPLLTPEPRVLLRHADDVAFMSPEVLREKLRRVNYRSPTVTQPTECAVDGCPHLTIDTICWECQVHIDARVEDARLRLERRRANAAFWPALLMILALLALLFYAASQAGSTLRAWGWL